MWRNNERFWNWRVFVTLWPRVASFEYWRVVVKTFWFVNTLTWSPKAFQNYKHLLQETMKYAIKKKVLFYQSIWQQSITITQKWKNRSMGVNIIILISVLTICLIILQESSTQSYHSPKVVLKKNQTRYLSWWELNRFQMRQRVEMLYEKHG